MNMMQNWLNSLCGGKTVETEGQPERHSLDVPFRFKCGECSSREWIKRENARCEAGEWQDGRRVHRLCWADRESALSCVMELTEFADFPAMEWVVRLRCEGVA